MLACRSDWLVNSPDIFNALSCKETGNENMGTRGCDLVITGNYDDGPTKNQIVLGELTFRSWE